MTRISGPIDYSGGYPPRHSPPHRRAAGSRRSGNTRENAPHAAREHAAREHAAREHAAREHAVREFAKDARHEPVAQHRARRVVSAPEDDAEYSARHRRRPQHDVQLTEEIKQHRRHKREQRREERRQRRQPYWRWARRIAGVLLLAGVAELIVAALTAPMFEVRNVKIVGAQITSRERMAAIVGPLAGQNWVRARTAPAARRLANLPPVYEARITRDFAWPPSLTVHLEERRPFVRIGSRNVWWIVDEHGVPFRRAHKGDDGLYALNSPKLQPREGRRFSGSTWQRAARIVRALEAEKQRGYNWPLRRIYLDQDDFVSLRLTGGVHDELLVRLGVSEWPRKLERARQALDYFQKTGRHAQVLNLVSYNRPAWTPRFSPSQHSSSQQSPTSTVSPHHNGNGSISEISQNQREPDGE